MATTARRKLTYEEFQDLAREDRKVVELIDGEVFVTPAPRTAHQRALRRLVFAIHSFVEENDLGEVFFAPYDVVFSKWTALEPDLLFIRKERSEVITDANVQGAPDLVVEVLSPSNKPYDRERKRRLYESGGVPEVWYVDPEDRTVEILVLSAARRYEVRAKVSGNDRVISDVLSGLDLAVAEIFRG